MALITIRPFNGMAPIISPQALPGEMAQDAVNTKLIYGDLRPWRGTTQVNTPTKPGTKKTIYRFGEDGTNEAQYWFSWTTDVDIVRAPIADDTTERTYYTGDGYPQVTNATLALTGGTNYPVNSYRLGVPAPASSTEVTVNATPPGVVEITLNASQVADFNVGDVLSVEVDTNSAVNVTLTAGDGGDVTAASLASQLDGISGVSATASGSTVTVSTDSSDANSKLTIKIKTGEDESFAEADVTYTNFVNTTYGVNENNTDPENVIPATGATHTFSAADIAAITPGQRLSIKINENADILVTVLAGVGTFPAAVTAESLRTALRSISGWTVTVNEGASQTVTVTTNTTGSTASLRVRKVNPGVTPIFSTVASASNADSDTVPVSVAYVVTYVTVFDEESAPSGPTTVVDVKFGENTVTLSNIPTGLNGPYNITRKRIYRSNTGSRGTQYQFLVELPLAQNTYTDSTESSDLGEVVATWDWLPPPDDMQGLSLMANGIGLGFKGTTLYLSEPFALYAYPSKYNLSVESPIVGIGVFGQSAFIGTKGFPYIITGADPSTVSMVKLEAKQPCVSKGSIVQMMGGVVYASPDGLFMVGASGIQNVTAQILSRDDWQAYKPESIHAYELDNRYFAFYDTGTTQGCLVFSMGEKPSFSKLTTYATAGYNDKIRDALYLCINGNIVRFDSAESLLTYTWRSKKFRSPMPINVGAARVDANSYPVTFKLYADGVLKHTQTVQNQKPFRLPSGYKSQFYEIQMEGSATVNAVFFGETMSEMKV